MTFFNIWFNNNLSKQYNIINNLSNDSLDNNKWIPDNNIVLQYNKYLNNCAELNRLKYSLEYLLIPKSKQLIKEFIKKSRSQDQNDRSRVSCIRKEMSIIEKKISVAEKSITESENNDSSIVEKWNNYLENAKKFIQFNNVDAEITCNDILSDDGLYIMCKKILNNNIINIESDKYLKTIKDIKQFFDIGYTEKYTESINFIDFADYEKKLNELLDFETRNSLEAIKKAPKLFLYDNNKNPINYELNINNKPFELSDDIITILCEEYNNELIN